MPAVRIEWPLVEVCRIDEAMQFFALDSRGWSVRYNIANRNKHAGLISPWKYGFKGIKSIVEIRFTEGGKFLHLEYSAPHEYGFFANVDPQVDHPRWSQARERRIGGGILSSKVPTQMFNGYKRRKSPVSIAHGPAKVLLVPSGSFDERSRCNDPETCGGESHGHHSLCVKPLRSSSSARCPSSGLSSACSVLRVSIFGANQ